MPLALATVSQEVGLERHELDFEVRDVACELGFVLVFLDLEHEPENRAHLTYGLEVVVQLLVTCVPVEPLDENHELVACVPAVDGHVVLADVDDNGVPCLNIRCP